MPLASLASPRPWASCCSRGPGWTGASTPGSGVTAAPVLANDTVGEQLSMQFCLARTAVWERVYGSRKTAYLHTSTFGGGTRACAVGLKTLEILVRDRLPEHAERMGRRLMTRLQDIKDRYPLLADVRGRGLLLGVDFAAPRIGTALAREYAGSVAAALLWQEHHIVTINTLNNPGVMRIEPPLVITQEQVDRVADAMEAVARRHKSVLGATARVGVRSLRGRSATRRRPGGPSPRVAQD